MYKTKRSLWGKIMSCVLAVAMLMSMSAVSAFAATPTEAGNYTVDATLSCYVNAMGGVEFADGMYTGAKVTVDENGDAEITVGFTASQVTIYSVTCDTFVDATNSTPGYYDENGEVQTAEYTLSENTALNPNSESINYVNSMTFPVDVGTETVYLWIYVNSNVMGCQFGDGSGTGSSNQPGVSTSYKATLTIDWESAVKSVEPDKTSNQSANVEGGYEVEIPATITVDATTKKGEYTVTAKNFVIGENAYVTVTASESGKLTNGSDELAFTNTLAGGNLTKTGDTLAGTVEVTGSPSNPGKYTSTIDFVISYYAGE